MISALLLAAALPLAAPETSSISLAEGPAEIEKDPAFGSFELRLSGYRPNIDDEFSGGQTPFADIFGYGRKWMFRAHFGKAVWEQVGTLEVGFGVGYSQMSGYGLTETGDRSGDKTKLQIVPLALTLTYRFDWAVDRFPLVPYARFSLERYQWWTKNGSGGTSADGLGNKGSGATNGYSFTGGVAFLLNVLDSGMAREMRQSSGIQQAYIFVDVTKSYISDFGSSSSWDLSDDRITIAGGLMVVF